MVSVQGGLSLEVLDLLIQHPALHSDLLQVWDNVWASSPLTSQRKTQPIRPSSILPLVLLVRLPAIRSPVSRLVHRYEP